MPLIPVLAAASGLFAGASSAPQAPDGVPPRPRLVVLVAVDQLIPEQLDRLSPWLDGGFGRFVREGRLFRSALLGHAATETGPGHASLSTGQHPDRHGIVANSFYDRVAQAETYCVRDAEAHALTSAGAAETAGSVSPKNLRAPGLADHLRAAFPGSKTVAIAGKDRAAVAMGGLRPDGAFWWDRRGGGFMSSTFYAEALPSWVATWNEGWLAKASGYAWTFSGEDGLPGSGTAADDREGEASYGPFGRVLPYRLPEVSEEPTTKQIAQFSYLTFGSPLGDAFAIGLAREAIDALDLGGDDEPDLLALGLSACDVVGHSFGPYSREVTELVLRTDDELGALFAFLDEKIGAGEWIACLSSDHGVLDLPEGLVANGVGAVRVPGSAVGEMFEGVKVRLAEEYGSDLGLAHGGRGLLLDEDLVREAGQDLAAVRGIARDAACEASWVARAFTWDELNEAGDEPDDPWLLLASRSFAPDRAPDVVLHIQPWHLLGSVTGTSHGSPYLYDRRVPLGFLAPGCAPGTSFEPVLSVDAAPTLLALLGVVVPADLDGRVLPLD